MEQNHSHDPKIMTLGEHLGELRSRLVKSLWAVALIFFTAYAFANDILMFLEQPLLEVLPKEHSKLHFTGPMDVFMANIKVSFLAALIGSAPIWLYQFWKFVEPALYPSERKYVFPFITASVLLFFAGVSFCFFVMIPVALGYLINLGMEVGTPIITVTDYLSLLILLVLAFGVMFETPLILVLMAMMDLIDASTLAKNRKIVFVIILIISAVITPSPDPISQLMLAGPTYLMFEASIWVIKLIKGSPKKAEVPTAI